MNVFGMMGTSLRQLRRLGLDLRFYVRSCDVVLE